jgi:hypothetical protein
MLALASCQMSLRDADARPGEDWKCGRLPVFVYADKYGDENGENRPAPPFKLAFDHGKTGKRLPSHLFTGGGGAQLYYRGRRCTWIDDPPDDTAVPSRKEDIRQLRQPVIRALGR